MVLAFKIAVLGFGNMAKALLDGAVRAGKLSLPDITVYSPSLANGAKVATYAITNCNSLAVQGAKVVILATKPDKIPTVCYEISQHLDADAVIVSIAAGVTTTKIQQYLGNKNTPIIRIMPNTPIDVGYGASGFYKNAFVTDNAAQHIMTILESTGIVVTVKEESDLDKITAISGSGPAYFLLIQEMMYKAAMNLGLSDSDANILVKQTMLGTSVLINQNNLSFSETRQKVASKGGTTAAAIKCLIDGGVELLIENAINKAYHRAMELSKDVTDNPTNVRFFQDDALGNQITFKHNIANANKLK